jgi:hypothetical protein
MPFFPPTPTPSHVSAPAIIDPVHRFTSDSGYEIRRSKHSRPRRRWTVEWLGKTAGEMHGIRDFLHEVRGGALEFGWVHPTAFEFCVVGNTTPIQVSYPHGLVTGQAVAILVSTLPGLVGTTWGVTRLNSTLLTLNGSNAQGVAGYALINVYVPHAVAILSQDTWESPVKLIGPEQDESTYGPRRQGYFNWSVTIEETF